MKTIALTQRVDKIEGRNEKRDALDQNLVKFVYTCGYFPVLIPNHPELLSDYLTKFPVDGIILSGGNNLLKYGGDSPERDETEKILIEFSIKNNVPLFGICRGMQMIQDYFGVPLKSTPGHTAVREKILFDGRNIEVNSYHNLGTVETSNDIEILAKAEDGVIKSIKHSIYNIFGIMWHPEREIPFNNYDIQLVKSFFK